MKLEGPQEAADAKEFRKSKKVQAFSDCQGHPNAIQGLETTGDLRLKVGHYDLSEFVFQIMTALEMMPVEYQPGPRRIRCSEEDDGV